MAPRQNAASAAKVVGAAVTDKLHPDETGEAANDIGTAIADQDAMSIVDLAHAVLSRAFRPRASSVRRLAEAVIEAEIRSAPKPKKAKPAKSGKSTVGKKKKKKLAKIPGQRK